MNELIQERTQDERELYEQVVDDGKLASRLKRSWKTVAPMVFAAVVLLLKFKGLLLFVALKAKWLLATLKLTNLFTTGASMLVSIGLYAVAYGFYFALGFVALIFVHEMGHVVMLRKNGIKATAPLFIPFFGAFVAMKEMPKNARVEAEVALGGPLLGTLGAVVAFGMYLITGHGLFAALAYVGFLINLFNLIPMTPLDGGRIVGAISRYLWLVGALLLLGVFLATRDPFFLIILLFAGGQLVSAWRHPASTESYYRVPFATRIGVSVVYFGLVAFLGVSMAAVGLYVVDAKGIS